MLFYLLISLGAVGAVVWKSQEKIKNFIDLNKALQENEKTHEKSICSNFTKTLKFICKVYWIMFLNRINNSVEHKGDKVIISYVANGRLYKLLTKARKGPIVIQLVLDENAEDVSDEVLPFYGPERNWHKIDFTPEFWGKKKLIFELASGEAKEFLEKEKIEI